MWDSSQDLTVFNVTAGAVAARQAQVSPVQPAIIGPSDHERTLDARNPAPKWWADAAIDWQAEVN